MLLLDDAVCRRTSPAARQSSYFVPLQTHVTSSGALHIVADERSLLEALDSLDLPRARLLTRLSGFWDRQARCAVAFEWHMRFPAALRLSGPISCSRTCRQLSNIPYPAVLTCRVSGDNLCYMVHRNLRHFNTTHQESVVFDHSISGGR